MTPALQTNGLGRRYGRRTWALRNCTLSLPPGRIIALVGPNGAGKTTLLHLTIGLLKPTEGGVAIFGQPVGMRRPAGMAQVGFVAQDHPLYRGFSVADLVHLGRNMNPGFDQEYAVRRLQAVGVPLRRRAGSLSGGQQAQVALTLALAKRPRLLVLDEPVASLDPLARREFMKALVDAAAGEGLTVLLSSHVVAELERVCDHLVLLRHGTVALAGDIDELLDHHRLLVGPRDAPAPAGAVVAASHGNRHSNLLMRYPPGATPHPRWESHPVSLEDLVLAYLDRPTTMDTSVTGETKG